MEGIYSFNLKVTDDSSASANTIVSVTVNTRVLFDIGPDLTSGADAGGKYWNNITDGTAGVKVSNAVTTGNTTTGISLSVVNRIDGTFNTAGPGTNTGNSIGVVGDYPVSATADFAFAHPSASNGQWKISGLVPSKVYAVKFWGTRTAPDERVIKIKRSDESTWLQYDARNNVDFNNGATFTFTGKTEMAFDISVDANSSFGHISVVDIQVTNAPVVCTAAITISSNQSVATCSGTAQTFTAIPINGGTAPAFQWQKNAMDIPGATLPTFTTTTLLNNEVITCKLIANTSCGTGNTATSNAIAVSILPIVPKAGTISGPTAICSFIGSSSNATYSIAPLANATIYVWSVPPGASIVSGQGTNSINVSYAATFGTVDTIAVLGGFCTNSLPTQLVVNKTIPAIPGAISGPVDPCIFVGQTTTAGYSIAPVANATSYTWTVPAGATIVSGQGTTNIQVSYSNGFVSGSIKVTADANCGSRAPRSLTVSAKGPAAPTAITGPTSACSFLGTNNQVTYSIASVVGASSYTWTLPANVLLVSGQGTTSIIVTFSAGYTSSAIKVRSVSNCASSGDRSLNVTTSTSSTPGAISGPTNACAFIGNDLQATYTIRKVSNASAYIWTVPAGMAIISHPGGAGINDTIVRVVFNSNFISGSSIAVQSAGCVPSAARSLSIIKTGGPSTPSAISGEANPCAFVGTNTTTAYHIAQAPGASSYNWSVPAGSTATHPNGVGVNDTIILVTYNTGFTSGTISVTATNGCGTSSARSFSVKALVPSTTPTITGPTDPCLWIGTAGATYTIRKIANATAYTWTIPSAGATVTHPNGAGMNDTIIIVNFTTAFVSGNITARADAVCGSSSVRTLSLVRKMPSTPGNITTTLLSACPARQYSYAIAVLPANATSATWTVPAGATIVSGQGTTAITVSYPATAVSSAVTVRGTNNCGNSSSARTATIQLPACSALPKGSLDGGEIPMTISRPVQIESGLEVKILANPTYNDFRLVVLSDDKKTPVYIRMSDISSKMLEIKRGIIPGQQFSFGNNYGKGVYLGEIIQGSHHKVIKLIKL